jgi:hypothetical protein
MILDTKSGVAVFTAEDNPIVSNLTPNAQSLISKDYSGTNPSKLLAELYSNKVEAGELSSLDQVKLDNEEVVSDFAEAKLFMKRFGFAEKAENPDFISLFYSLNETLDFSNYDNKLYIVELYNSLSETTKASITSTVRHLYSLNRGRDEFNRVPAKEIKKYVLLNKALRSEGVVLTATEVFYCSLAWSEQEVFNLLEKGLSLSDSLKLHEVGFKTIDEIVEYGSNVPMDWVNQLLD